MDHGYKVGIGVDEVERLDYFNGEAIAKLLICGRAIPSAKYAPHGVVATVPLISEDFLQSPARTMTLAVPLDGFAEDLIPHISDGEEVAGGLHIREEDLGHRVLRVLAMIHQREAQPMGVASHMLIYVVGRMRLPRRIYWRPVDNVVRVVH